MLRMYLLTPSYFLVVEASLVEIQSRCDSLLLIMYVIAIYKPDVLYVL